ncbi:MAG: prenyltransferase/squalene oxidase repeat-containing protein [Planctomycetota bacterium]
MGPREVNPVVKRSIKAGLRFLAKSQGSDGGFGKGSWENTRYRTYAAAITPLAGLAFLASGSTPTRGPYAKNLQMITDFILKQCVGKHSVPTLIAQGGYREERPMYCHAFNMTYLALIFAQETNDKRKEKIRKVLRDAIEVTGRTQTRDGGWGYRPDDRDDEGTLVVTFLQGLRACRDAGIYVPKTVIDKGIKYIKDSTNPNGSVRYRVRSTRTRPGVTCASVVALWQAGEYESPLLKLITDHVIRYVEPRHAGDWSRGHHAEYVQYYLAQSQHILGGDRWTRYYKKVSAVLTAEQNTDGSWEGRDQGDIYGTVIALLVLQLPYNRLSIYQR